MQVYYPFSCPRRLKKNHLVLFVLEHSAASQFQTAKWAVRAKPASSSLDSYWKSWTPEGTSSIRRHLHKLVHLLSFHLHLKVIWWHFPQKAAHQQGSSTLSSSLRPPSTSAASFIALPFQKQTKSSLGVPLPKCRALQLMQHSLSQPQLLLGSENYKPIAGHLIKGGMD